MAMSGFILGLFLGVIISLLLLADACIELLHHECAWRDCQHDPPPSYVTVLVMLNGYPYKAHRSIDDIWYVEDMQMLEKPQHWMYLPEDENEID
jgi:hypothetical protein